MEPPTPKEEVKSEKTYIIKSNKNQSFSTIVKNLVTSIEIISTYQDDIIKRVFTKKYNLNELKNENKYFLLYETINELYEDLILLMNKEQTKIMEDINTIKICIPLESLKIKEIFFVLNESEKNDKEKIEELYLLISDLKKELKEVKEENKILKEKINVFESYIPYLEDYKKKLEEEKNKEIIKNLDSLIIQNNMKYNKTLKNWINPNLDIKAELLYRASRDGEEYQTFHKLCDYKGPTVVLAKLYDGSILGTYTPIEWETKTKGWKNDPDIFVFSLTENIKATKKTNYNEGIYCHPEYGPESYFLCFQCTKKMKEPKLRIDTSEYEIDTQRLVPGKKNGSYYKADEVEVFRIIIG